MRRVAMLAALVLLAAACSGPGRPLEVGVKELPTDVILGAQQRPVVVPSAPLPPASLALPAAAIPAPDALALPARPADPCPAADPLAGPRVTATLGIDHPPVEAEYPFRVEGTYEISGPNAAKGVFPPVSTRWVENVQESDDGSFTFDVRVELGFTTTVTAYRVVPRSPVPVAAEALPLGSGLFIDSVTTTDGDAEPVAFRPTPPILALPTPAESGTSWRVQSTDVDRGLTVSWTATIGNRERVDACGVPVDGVPVHLDGEIRRCVVVETTQQCLESGDTPGAATDPASATVTRFVHDEVYATQFGGIAIRNIQDVTDDVAATISVHRAVTSTIAVEPKARAS